MSKRVSKGGTIRKRKDKPGCYEGRYRTGIINPETGREIRVSVYGHSKEEVRKKMYAKITELDSGRYIQQDGITVKDYLLQWMDTFVIPTCKPATIKAYNGYIRNHIDPALGRQKVQSITRDTVQKFVNNLSKAGKSPKTIKNIHGMLFSAFKEATASKLIASNPCECVRLPKSEQPDIRPLSLAEMRNFESVLEEDVYSNLFGFLMFSGLRKAEALALTWDSIDFRNRLITVNKQISEDPTRKHGNRFNVVYTTKTGAGKRTFQPMEEAFSYLKKQWSLQNSYKEKFGKDWTVIEGFPRDLVFTAPDGRYLDPSTVWKRFKFYAGQIDVPSLRIHDLRHTYVTLVLAATNDYKTVSESVGHSTPQFTMQRYQHVTREMQETTAAKATNYYQEHKSNVV